jgi:hypothetical protein
MSRDPLVQLADLPGEGSMSEDKIFRISLPTLFERVNTQRREQGLPVVEPAIMAVRASIKFAIRRHKHVDLKADDVEMEEGDADALCASLAELFNVDLPFDHPNEPAAEAQSGMPPIDTDDAPADAAAPPRATAEPAQAPAAAQSEGEARVLPLFRYYAAINRERRNKGLPPVEPAVISVRTGIKFSILRRRTLNFRENRLMVDQGDLRVLDDIVVQQFDVEIPGGVASLCDQASQAKQAGNKVATRLRPGVMARLLSRLRGRPLTHHTHHYSLDTQTLLLSIITRRAYVGHKPITPEQVRSRCGKALSAELELEVDMDDDSIRLTPDQLDAFADIIRQEFEIMFEDLDDLLDKAPRT